MKKSRSASPRGTSFRLTGMFLLFLSLAQAGLGFVTNQDANIVIGQPDMTSGAANQGTGSAWSNTLNQPYFLFCDGTKLYVSDSANHRILIYNTIPTSNGALAAIVVGQPNLTSNAAPAATNSTTLSTPVCVTTYNNKLLVADAGNNRVLIYNSIPASNGAAANIVIGQPDMAGNLSNQGSGAAANSLSTAGGAPNIYVDSSGQLYIADYFNNRVLIYTSLPTSNNASANIVIGQPDMAGNGINHGLGVGIVDAYALYKPSCVQKQSTKLLITDSWNRRVLIYNQVPTTNYAAADTVVGQTSLTVYSVPGPDSNTDFIPRCTTTIGAMLAISDPSWNRVLIYNQVPTSNNAFSDIVIGQQNMTSTAANQGVTAGSNTLANPHGLASDGINLLISDTGNNRIFIYHPPTPTVTPTFTATLTRTSTPTRTVTPTITLTSTITVTITQTCTSTITLTPLPSSTITPYAIPHDQILAYPSPAAGKDLWFYYFSPEAGHVRFEIFNLLGEPCKTIEENIQTAGYTRTHWDISKVAPGIYFYRMTLEHAGTSLNFPIRKLVIVKK